MSKKKIVKRKVAKKVQNKRVRVSPKEFLQLLIEHTRNSMHLGTIREDKGMVAQLARLQAELAILN